MLRLLDQSSFKCAWDSGSRKAFLHSQSLRIALYEVPCDPAEHINTTHAVTLSKATYLCVGTVVVDPHDLEPTKGRLVVFKVHTEGERPSLHLVSSTPVQGCVYAIVSRKNTLALSVNSAVSPRQTGRG